MLVLVASSLVLLNNSRRRDLLVSPEDVGHFWNENQLRALVMLSLAQQIILILFGSRRKYMVGILLSFLVWSTYLLADSLATISLSLLSRQQGETKGGFSNVDNGLHAFWAPFLLLHLGGVDTITAFSLEDSDLWLRRLLNLSYQVAITCYIIYLSWKVDTLVYISILMLIVGLVKCGERIWVLRSAGTSTLFKSLISLFDPSRRYNESVQENSRGFGLEADILRAAYFFLMIFVYYSSDIIVNQSEMQQGYSFMLSKSAADVFKLIETELGLLYDALYTKTVFVRSCSGIILRFVSFMATVSALAIFITNVEKYNYQGEDKYITYVLLAGGIILEIYAAVLATFSDWTMFWLADRYSSKPNTISRAIFYCRSTLCKVKRWSESMSQLNVIEVCLKADAGKFLGIDFFSFADKLKEKWYSTRVEVNNKMKELIVAQISEKHNKLISSYYDPDIFRQLLDARGDYILQSKGDCRDMLWSIEDFEYDESMLIWHFATDLCYYDDLENHKYQEAKNLQSNCKISKCFSDYMVYLFVLCPDMLPKGGGERRYRVTCEEFFEFLKEFSLPQQANVACTELLKVPQGRLSGSLISDGCKLARSLQSRVLEGRWTQEEKWEFIIQVWVEMLGYVASRCEWKQHAQQLAQGGQLLTVVCFLMMHFNFTEQFKLIRRYPREPAKKSFAARIRPAISKLCPARCLPK